MINIVFNKLMNDDSTFPRINCSIGLEGAPPLGVWWLAMGDEELIGKYFNSNINTSEIELGTTTARRVSAGKS